MILKINTVDIAIKPAPNGFKCNIKDLDYNNSGQFGRAINGQLSRNRIAVKRTLTLTFNAMKWSDLSALLTQMQDEFFDVYYPDILTGAYETKTFYVSDRPALSVATQLSTDDDIWWNGVTFNLIER